MASEMKKSYHKVGFALGLSGFFLSILGYMSLPGTWMQATYPGDIYWGMILGILGAGLMLIGVAIFFKGELDGQ